MMNGRPVMHTKILFNSNCSTSDRRLAKDRSKWFEALKGHLLTAVVRKLTTSCLPVIGVGICY